jgi:hypothetical protein
MIAERRGKWYGLYFPLKKVAESRDNFSGIFPSIHYLWYLFFTYWRISLIGKAAVLKTAGFTPMGVRVPHPPHEKIQERWPSG